VSACGCVAQVVEADTKTKVMLGEITLKNLDNCDAALIEAARNIITKNFDNVRNNHTVGAAVRCKNGKIYLGVNVYLNHGTCAEIFAIGAAITAGEREFDCIVSVRGEGEILPPCGNCRQMLSDYAPLCDVIIVTENGEKKIQAKELIPYSYARKIF